MEAYFKTQLITTAMELAKKLGKGDEYVSNIFISKYPEFLYKYRVCEDRAFSLITDGHLWASPPDKFDDPMDSLVALSSEEELTKIEGWLKAHVGEIAFFLTPPIGMAKEKNGFGLSEYVQEQRKISDFCKHTSEKDCLDEYLSAETKRLPKEDQDKVKEALSKLKSLETEKQLMVSLEEAVLPVVNALRQSIFVYCLSTDKDNSKMWETYGDKYSGFVIEYDMHSCMRDPTLSQTLRSTFPVKYENERPSAFSLDVVQCWYAHVFHGAPFSNIAWQASLLEHAMYKKEEFREEKEWRVISAINAPPSPVISAVYAGYKITSENESRLREVCAEKNIPLFKQEINRIARKMTFSRIDGGDAL